MQKLSPLPLRNIIIDDPFWSERIRTALDTSIDYMWRALNDEVPGIEPSHCIRNFRIAAGLEEGDFKGFVFQDSDLYKWLEAVAYSLEIRPDAGLKARADDAIDLVRRAQLPNGYIDTYIMLNRLEPWSDTCRAHEMYCAGHMLEAAAAYLHATGDGGLLGIARAFADNICETFGDGPGKLRGYPGHQEIEIGLYKLYQVTGEEKYLKMAKFFLDERGRQPYYYDIEQERRVSKGGKPIDYFRNHGVMPFSYQQAHLPVREQMEAVGHAVRCVYMCAGMADVGSACDGSLLDAARTLYDNIVETQMYITGGIGSMGDGEAFTFPYDLPNDRMYNETCASIGLMMVSQRLLNTDGNARYADVLERALYNNVLAGVSLKGTEFFYVNPMEMWPERSLRRHDMKEVVPVRQGWYGCACCPPNVLRTLLGLGQYIYSAGPEDLYVNLFVGSTASAVLGGREVTLAQKGRYPQSGAVTFIVNTVSPARFRIHLRIPGWCGSPPSLSVNGEAVDITSAMRGGYAVLDREFCDGDMIALGLPMAPRFIYCDDRVPYDAGKAALQRGPLIYCIEEQDNGPALWNLAVDPDAPVCEREEKDLLGGVITLTASGSRRYLRADALYTAEPPKREAAKLTFIPYYSWNNRTPGEMSVWQCVDRVPEETAP